MADLKALFSGKPSTPTPKESTDEKNEAQAPATTGGQEAATQQQAPKPAQRGFGGLRIAGQREPDAESSESKPESTPPKPAGLGGIRIAGSASDSSDKEKPVQSLTLDDLESSEDEGLPPDEGPKFSDEVPCDAPLRELPPEMTKEMTQFVDLIDGVYKVTNEPDLVGTVIKSIMIELKSNPQYMKLVAPDDVRTWIRAMRETMGLAKVQKATKRTAAASRKSAKVDYDMLDDLKSLGLGDIS